MVRILDNIMIQVFCDMMYDEISTYTFCHDVCNDRLDAAWRNKFENDYISRMFEKPTHSDTDLSTGALEVLQKIGPYFDEDDWEFIDRLCKHPGLKDEWYDQKKKKWSGLMNMFVPIEI